MDTRKTEGNSGKCIFMNLPKCLKQDTSKRLDMSVCNACIGGRQERHLFNIRENVERLIKLSESKQIKQ